MKGGSRVIIYLLVVMHHLIFLSDARSAIRRPLTVADSVERSLIPWNNKSGRISYSRDGGRYLVMIAKGDIEAGGVWMSFVTGKTDSLAGSAPKESARLFTTAYGNRPVTSNNPPHWLYDNERVAFLWEDEHGTKQVYILDLINGKLKKATDHDSDVIGFEISDDGNKILYTAYSKHDRSKSIEMEKDGFATINASGSSFIKGELDGWNKNSNVELFLMSLPGGESHKLSIPSGFGASSYAEIHFSPDGRRATIALPVDPPHEWDRYQDRMLKSWINASRFNPSMPKISQLHVVDIERRSIRPLWNAAAGFDASVVWVPDGESLVVGPAFLPPEGSSEEGLKGRAIAVVDVRSGAYETLPRRRPKSELRRDQIRPVDWRDDMIGLATNADLEAKQLFRRLNGHWEEVATATPPKMDQSSAVTIEIREDLNSPPAIYAVDPDSGSTRMVLDIDPSLRTDFLLGNVELMRWADPDGRSWSGRLYLPVGYRPTHRVPLVIQLKGFSETEFSLSGSDLYPSTFVAQVLANRGIATLQMENDFDMATPREPKSAVAGMLAAIKKLVMRGIVDEARVGLSGFSRTGWYVHYAIANSNFPFAAALSADHINAGYMQDTLWGGVQEFSLDNGAEPFGAGLAAWLEEAPAFNADRVRTPLRIQIHGGADAAIGQWEMFSRLRRLHRPVELYVVPEADKAAHNLQNPRQVLASREGAVDWFEFWLNEREDPNPSKASQYARWRLFRVEQEAALKQPRRALLKWSATPVN